MQEHAVGSLGALRVDRGCREARATVVVHRSPAHEQEMPRRGVIEAYASTAVEYGGPRGAGGARGPAPHARASFDACAACCRFVATSESE